MGRKSTLIVGSVVVVLTVSTLVQMYPSHDYFINIHIQKTFEEINDEKRTSPWPREQRDAFTLLASDIPGREDSLTWGKNNSSPDDSSILIESKQPTPARTASPTPTKSKKTAPPPPPYIQVTDVPSQRSSPASSLISNATRPNSVSLVVGYWAQPGSFIASTSASATSTKSKYAKPHPHRAEIEAAMVNNMHNPYIHQLVVILDSISDEANCTHHFIPHMQRLSSLVQSKHPQFFKFGSLQLPGTLTCIDRLQGQPTYLEMFQYSSSSTFVEGPIVVMANTDQAFDSSLKVASHLQPNSISVLSTAGFNRKLLPPSLQAQYKTIMSQGGRPPPKMYQIAPNRCNTPSWDSYLFERDMVARGLQELDDPTLFVRGEKQPVRYFMNENGAENAALHDLTKALMAVMAPSSSSSSSSQEPANHLTVWNSCFLIQSWHFHLEQKTHKKRKGKGSWDRVPGPSGPTPKACGSSMAKLVFDPMFLAVLEKQQQQGTKRKKELPVPACPPPGTKKTT